MKRFFTILFVLIPCVAFSQDDFQIRSKEGRIPSLEDISKQLGNPIAVISWRNQAGILRIKRAVKGGNYERRYVLENETAVFEDRAEMDGQWQEWYQTGANKLGTGETLEIVLKQIWGSWEYAMTLYHENIDKTMVIKFYKSADDGFVFSEDGYLYLYGYWYFIDGKL